MTASTPKRRFRFSLRMLLVFVTVCAILCGWVTVRMQKAKNQQEAVEAIRKAGGQVYYFQDKQNSDGNEYVGEKLPRGVWLQSFVGRARVFKVSFSDTKTNVSDAELQHVKKLPDLQHLFVDGTQITDAGLAYIEGLSELEVLYLDFTKVTDAGLEHIHDLPQLRFVSLDNTRVTGAGFRYFKGLPQLQDLSMDAPAN